MDSQREIVHILRCITDSSQKNWDKDLPFVQLVINSNKHRGIGVEPLKAMTGREVFTSLEAGEGFKPEHKEIAHWNRQLTRMRRLIAATQGRYHNEVKERYNENVDLEQTKFKIGDKVLVRFYRVAKGKTLKLAPRQQGPYIIKGIKQSTLKLQHFENSDDIIERHVSHVIRYKEGGDVNGGAGDHEYEVESIVDETKKGKETLYRIRFLGFPSFHDVWMTEEDLKNAPLILEKWKQSRKEEEDRLDELRSKKVTITKIVSHRKTKKDGIKYLVCTNDEFGPYDNIELTRERILNKEIVDDYNHSKGLSHPNSSKKKKGTKN